MVTLEGCFFFVVSCNSRLDISGSRSGSAVMYIERDGDVSIRDISRLGLDIRRSSSTKAQFYNRLV